MGRKLTDAEKAQRQAMGQVIGEEVVRYRADNPGMVGLCASEMFREWLLVRFGWKSWRTAVKEARKWWAMALFHAAAMDRISAALTGMTVQELSQLRADDPEEAERRGAEALRLPKDFQDFLIDGALDDLFPKHERRDV
jgi:hypothetical protein